MANKLRAWLWLFFILVCPILAALYITDLLGIHSYIKDGHFVIDAERTWLDLIDVK